MTRRERLEARLEKRRLWAEGRERKAEAASERARVIASGIPMGQPILVGHHSERHHRRDLERIDSAMRQTVESSDMARHHESKAAGIEAQLEGSIFSDDPDAPAALAARIAELEAQRERMKQINRMIREQRKRTPDPAACLARLVEAKALTVKEAADLARSYALQPYHGLGFPAYALQNLGGNINRLRKRVIEVERRRERTAAAEKAGGVLIECAGDDYVRVTFEEKPERSILDALKAAGFSWSGGSWFGRRDRMPEGVR